MEPMHSEPQYSVRQAGKADVSAVTTLVNRAFEIERFFKDGDRTDARGVAAMLRLGKILLLTCEERIVACVFVKQAGDRLYAGMLAADPDWPVPRAGLRLMDETEVYARAAGCKWLDIRIVSVRPELNRLYRRRGFVETGTEPGDSINSATVPVHFITMTKPL
jgi:hypothetical protein